MIEVLLCIKNFLVDQVSFEIHVRFFHCDGITLVRAGEKRLAVGNRKERDWSQVVRRSKPTADLKRTKQKL
jgi:hypothetical protein